MPRAGLSPDVVVARAGDLADASGYDALSLAVLADDLGVRVPSLYKHVGGLPDLQRRLALAGMRDLLEALARATSGLAGREALGALATAHRAYARRHPGRYAATLRAPRPGEGEELLAVAGALTELLLDVLRGYGRTGADAVHAARTVRAALHGFVALEAAGGFGLPEAVDDSYARLVDALDAALRRAPSAA